MTEYVKKIIGHRKFLGLMDRVTHMASSLFAVLFFSKILPKEEFGLFGLAMSLFLLFAIIESFFQTPTVKFCATYQNEKLNDAISSLLYLKTISVIFFIALVWITRPFILKFYHAPGLDEIMAMFPILFVSFTLRSHFVSIIRAQRNMKALLWQDLVFALMYIALGILFFKNIATAKDVFLIFLTSHITSVLYLWIRYPQYIKFRFKLDKELTKEIFHYGKYTAIVGIGGVIYQNLDILMIGSLTSIGDVGVYKIGKISATFVLTVSQGMLLTMLPEIADLNDQNKISRIKNLYSRNVRQMLQIFVPFFILSVLFANSMYSFFFHDKYAGASAVFIIFAASGIIRAFGNPQGALLSGVGLVKQDSIQMIVCLIVNVVLNVLLIPPFKAVGAALATVIALLVGTVIKEFFVRGYFLKKEECTLAKT